MNECSGCGETDRTKTYSGVPLCDPCFAADTEDAAMSEQYAD